MDAASSSEDALISPIFLASSSLIFFCKHRIQTP